MYLLMTASVNVTLLRQIRPWYDAWAIACARAVTHANQEKGGLGRQ